MRLAGIGLFAIFAALCAYSLRMDLERMPFVSLWHAWDIVLIAASFSLINYALRSARWWWYLRQWGYLLPLGFSTLTYVAGFAFTLSPGKLGEIVRARYYKDVGISVQYVTAAVFAERLLDLLAMVTLAMLTTTAFPEYAAAIWTTAIGIIVLIALLMVLPWTAIARSIRVTLRGPAMLLQLGATVAGTLASARSLLAPRAVLWGLLVSVVAWGLEGVGLGLLSHAVTPSLNVSVAIGIYSTAVLVGAISFLPGGLGSTEVVMTALLVTQGFVIEDALLITLACRIVTLWLGVCLGWLAIAILRFGRKWT